MSWTIDKDHLYDGEEYLENREGWSSSNRKVTRNTRGAKRFKLYDDDGILYYEGWLTDEKDWEEVMEFGDMDAGCTSIRNGRGKIIIG